MRLNRTWMLSVCLLGVIATLGCTPESQDASIAAEIEKLGGAISYDEESPDRPIKGVLFGWWVTDAGMEHLKGLTGLQSLSIMSSPKNASQVTDAGLEHLKGLTSLKQLDLSGTKVTDIGLEYLNGLTGLEFLDLNGTQVTDVGLENLKRLTRLRDLGLYGTQVTDAGAQKLQEKLPDCKIIHTPDVSAPGTAMGAGRSFKAGWSIAFWDEEDSELVVGFLEAEPNKGKLERMMDHKDLFVGVFLEIPMIQFNVGFEEKNGAPDVASPKSWTVMYNNFGDRGPTMLNFSGGVGQVVEVSGNPKSGGKVTGRFTGTWVFTAGDDIRDYSWNLTFDLPVH